MISFIKGDLMESGAYALINTVNTVGVMGKGIALQFKIRFPYNYCLYHHACQHGDLKVGQLLVVQDYNLFMGDGSLSISPPKPIGVYPPDTVILRKASLRLGEL